MPLEDTIFVFQSFWKRFDHSVWVKAGLYTTDVGSDLWNGILMVLPCFDNSTTNGTSSLKSDNSTNDGTTSDCDMWWGSLTIAMTWLPQALTLLGLILLMLKFVFCLPKIVTNYRVKYREELLECLAWIYKEGSVHKCWSVRIIGKIILAIIVGIIFAIGLLLYCVLLTLLPLLAPFGM